MLINKFLIDIYLIQRRKKKYYHYQGEIFWGVDGSSASKSTLISAINGLQEPTSGDVIGDGKEIISLKRKIYINPCKTIKFIQIY